MKKDDKNNILDFPVHKMSLSKKFMNSSQDKDSKVSFDLENKKVLFSASMLSVLLAFSFLSNSLQTSTSHNSVDGRGIASLGEVSGSSSVMNSEWKKSLIKNLNAEQENVAYGEKPSILDELIFNELQGYYSVNLEKNQLQQIFLGNEKVASQLKEFSPTEFVKKFAGLLPDFDTMEEDRASHKENSKSYVMKKSGELRFKMNVSTHTKGYLESLVIEKH